MFTRDHFEDLTDYRIYLMECGCDPFNPPDEDEWPEMPDPEDA